MTTIDVRPATSRAETISRIANRIIEICSNQDPVMIDGLYLTWVDEVRRLLRWDIYRNAQLEEQVPAIGHDLWLAHEWRAHPYEAMEIDPTGAGEVKHWSDVTSGAEAWAVQLELDARTCACHLAGMAA